MPFRIQTAYGITCLLMIVFLYWAMSAITCLPRPHDTEGDLKDSITAIQNDNKIPNIIKIQNGNKTSDITKTQNDWKTAVIPKTQFDQKTTYMKKRQNGHKRGDITKTQNDITETLKDYKTADIINTLTGHKTSDIIKQLVDFKTADIIKTLTDHKTADIIKKLMDYKTTDITKTLKGHKTADGIKTQKDYETSEIIQTQNDYDTSDITKRLKEHEITKVAKINNNYETAVASVKKERVHDSPFPPTLVHGKDINPAIEAFFTLKGIETRDKFVNLHQYQFAINSRMCSDSDLFLIMIIHSAPQNFRKRSLIRKTFGSVRSIKGKKLAVVFMLGAEKNHSIQDEVNKEARLKGDIVQGNFADSYKSLIRKHIMAMHWFKYHCNADFILKLDDDTFVNPYRTVEYILGAKSDGLTIHCKIIPRDKPLRNSKSKWYTSRSQYPFRVFPPFCPGFAYITTPQTWAALYEASKTSRVMDMDDVYVTVILAMKAKVRKISMDRIMYQCPDNVWEIKKDKLQEKAIFLDRSSHCAEIPFFLWKWI